MGHVGGVVTISVAEADAVLRTTRKEALDEPYRTMIGHMRHEIAHMLWWRLSLQDFLTAFRETFGDEREDYHGAAAPLPKRPGKRIGKRAFFPPMPLPTPRGLGQKPPRTCCT